ncbi:hypothetical protein D3C78_766770 [compost metagenome]
MLEGGLRHQPALTALADDPVARGARVGEEHLGEAGAAGHLLERADLDTRLLEVEQQIGNTLVLGRCIWFGAHQQEHVVCQVGSGGPDFLSIDHPLIANQLGASAQRGQVAAGTRLAVALRPQVFTGDGLGHEELLLPLLALLEQSRHQHVGADTADFQRRSHAGELLADHLGLQHVRRLLGAAKSLRHIAIQVSLVDRRQAECLDRRGICRGFPVLPDKVLHLGTVGLVLVTQAQFHRHHLMFLCFDNLVKTII